MFCELLLLISVGVQPANIRVDSFLSAQNILHLILTEFDVSSQHYGPSNLILIAF